MEQTREQFITDQRNLLILKNSIPGIICTMISCLVFAYFFWGTVAQQWLLVWTSVNFIFGVVRLIFFAKCKYVVGKKNSLLMAVAVYGIPISGVFFSCILLYYINEPDLSVFYFFAICSLGMINGACSSYFIYLRLVVLYMCSLLIFPLYVLYIKDVAFFYQTLFYMITYMVMSTGVIFKIKKSAINRFGYMYDSAEAEKAKQISMSKLVAGMANEINTPLGHTMTSADFMKDKVSVLDRKLKDETMKRSDLEDTLDTLLESHEESENELDHVRDLVQTFKLVVPHYDIKEIKQFCLKDLLEKTSELIHYDQVNKLFDFAVIGEEVEIVSYPNAIKHVMEQLIQNSVKHGFNAETVDPKITVQIEKIKNNSVRLIYQHNGVGMGAKETKYFFAPFYRGNMNLENKGLGGNIILNTVTQILKGTITCGSQEHGCQFILEFPMNSSTHDPLAHLYEI